MSFALSEASKTNRIGIDPKLIAITDLAIKNSKVDFGISKDGGLRTTKQQNELFSAGKSKCDGMTKRSPHQDGEAVDLTAYCNGKPTWEHRYYAMLAVAMLDAANQLGHRIKWGGMFATGKEVDGVFYGWDCPHFELA